MTVTKKLLLGMVERLEDDVRDLKRGRGTTSVSVTTPVLTLRRPDPCKTCGHIPSDEELAERIARGLKTGQWA